MAGDGSGLFYPDRVLSRAELAEIIYNMEGRPEINAPAGFTDVPTDSWFYNAATWARSNGILYGTSEEIFAPTDDVDMEQLAVVLMRYAKAGAASGVDPASEGASEWAAEALRWAEDIGISPEHDVKETVNRGQAARILRIFCERNENITAVNCTVWPMTDLPVYSTPDGEEVVGTAPASDFYTVLDEENGKFRIDNGAVAGYIDSARCLIDLADYLGELCAYDIKNSYDSVFNVNGYGIPNVTGTVITGYEHVTRKDGTDATSRTAVPLLYPTAQKVAHAAVKAQKMGYRLKIYDAFRPKEATTYLYGETELALDKELPDLPYSHMSEEQWRRYAENVQESADPNRSFYFEMTRGDCDLEVFLAKDISTHNLGIAVDLTLERLSDGGELRMQTGMHDLSWRSFRNENNRNADLLSDIMLSSGLAPLSSEWWHFQDDEFHMRHPDLAVREEGVTVE